MSGQHKTKNSPTQSGCTSLKSVSRSLKFTQAVNDSQGCESLSIVRLKQMYNLRILKI